MENNYNMDTRLLNIHEACQYLNIKTQLARRLLEEIGAKVVVGNKFLYDKIVIDNYINEQTKGNE